MALQRQVIPIPLGVGVDQKTDPKQIQPGKLSELENGVFNKLGMIDTRFGLTAFARTILGTLNLTSAARQITTFKNELNLLDQTAFYSHSFANDAWIKRTNVTGATAESYSIIRNNSQQLSPDCASTQDVIVYAWEDSRGGVRASTYEVETGQPIVADVLISVTGSRPRLSANDEFIYIHYIDGANVVSVRIDPAEPTVFGAPVIIANNAHAVFPVLAVTRVGNQIILAFRTLVPDVKIGYIRADGNFGQLVDNVPPPQTVAIDPSKAMELIGSRTGAVGDSLYIVYADAVALKVVSLGYNLINNRVNSAAALMAPFVLDNAATDVRNISLCLKLDQSVFVFYENNAAVPMNRTIKKVTFGRGNETDAFAIVVFGILATASALLLRSLGLHSKAFTFNNIGYCVASFQTNLQATYFLISEEGILINRIAYTNGGGNTTKYSLTASVFQKTGFQFVVPTLVKSDLKSESGNLFSILGVQSTVIDFDSAKLFQSSELGGNLLLTAGMLLAYDGLNITELGFNVYPEDSTAVQIAGVITGNGGPRQYFVTYEWTDQQGQIHRSAQSLPITVIIANATTQNVTLTIPTLRLTSKANVEISVYRTPVGGTTAYRVSLFSNGYGAVNGSIRNDKTVDTINFTDALQDTAILGNEILYTTGGVIENIPPPSAKYLVKYNNRSFLIGLEDPNEIWFSKTYSKGYGVGFSDAFTLRIDQGRIGITGGGVIDEKIIFFKQNEIYYTAGQGPLDTGAMSDLRSPDFVTSDVGCIDGKTVTRVPAGLLFKSQKGWYLLDRSLQTQYIGAQVENYNNLTVSSVTLMDDKNQVRITHTDGVAIVYDYLFGQWSTFTNYNSVSATNWQGNFILAKATGEISREDTASYFDNGVPIRLRLVTPWLSLNQLQGFQRIYQAIFLGTFRSHHRFIVNIGYDFEDGYTETQTIDTVTALGAGAAYGGGIYGDGVFGGIDNVWQFKVKPMIQKCEAIRFEIYNTNPNLVNGAGFSISSMLVDVGGKTGLFKVPVRKVMSQ